GVLKLFGVNMYIAAAIIGFVIVMYDGLIGPGTGTFLIFAYTLIIGFDYITASGNAKIINLSSNLAAAFSYIMAGKVLWAIAIPAAISNLLGNYLGSTYALKNGNKAVKKMLIVVLVGIFVKLITDII
ncbi:MAG: TSUP family transporter, partial [Oscillospiraceae bacterium]|nr:TSUP family transporter [Oscillospiraceae bacterium]